MRDLDGQQFPDRQVPLMEVQSAVTLSKYKGLLKPRLHKASLCTARDVLGCTHDMGTLLFLGLICAAL